MNSDFGPKLKKARELRGMSQTILAKKIGSPPSIISHYESNRRKPSLDNLIKIADGLQVSIDSLLNRKVKPWFDY